MNTRSQTYFGSTLFVGVFAVMLLSCGSLKEESRYKNPETVLFHADKVLVVGMVSDYTTRLRFETRLKDAFTQAGRGGHAQCGSI